MAEVTYSGRGSRGPSSEAPVPQPQPQQQVARSQRPSTAAPRLEGNSHAAGTGRTPDAAGQRATARRMIAFLDSAERVAAKQPQPSIFPSSSDAAALSEASGHRNPQQRQRRKSTAPPLRASGEPRVRGASSRPEKSLPRQLGRVSLYDHGMEDHPPHQVPGPVILRDMPKPRVGFPTRPPEDFLRAGEGLSLRQRNKLKEHLKKNPVNIEAPFVPGTGGVRLAPGPSVPRALDWGASSPSPSTSAPASTTSRHTLSRSLLRTYYDNGTLDFVAVRWRGNRVDALVWARSVTKGPEEGGPLTRTYVSWAPEPPSELDVSVWLPIFIDGVREYDEPYRFLAIRGSEELLLKAGDTLHTFAGSLVSPLKSCLDTREPTVVAVALQLMNTVLSIDPRVAEHWVPHYWQFAQVLNLFRSRGGSLVVNLGYNSRAAASCRKLATAFMNAFEMAGGELGTAAIRRYSPGHDPAVTDASMARAAAKAAAKDAEAGRQSSAFKPFTLF
ncbi:hypothetical protein Vafri_14278 [Volvox africanus]|uniref:Uncharacterized protein n=1 Tax=Volvox africanus TaxID=51714 RepID=A0A8J4F6L0_9CHLO|nr:hypothetical protein Vafri_14278 [Volvox africanus]